MKTTSIRAKAFACALLAGAALCDLTAAPASAQTSPTFRNLDSNGVDLVKGDFLTSFAEGSIGSGQAELALLRMVGAIGSFGARGPSQWDHIVFQRTSSGNSVTFNTRRDLFPAAESRGASLTGSGAQYFYRSPDGTQIEFTDPSPGNDPLYCDADRTDCLLLPTTITSPDGRTVTINYEFYRRCMSPGGPDSTVCQNVARIASVTNSFGYEIRFSYAAGTEGTGPVDPLFHQRTRAGFYNNAAGSTELANVRYEYLPGGVTEILDQGGRKWRVTDTPTYRAVRRPGAQADTLAASISSGLVTSVVNEGVTTTYSRSAPGSIATMTVTQVDPAGPDPVSTIVSDLTIERPTSIADPTGRTTSFTYDNGRLKRTTAHEGNYVEHEYDPRGNVVTTTAVPKGGSGPAIVTSAIYDLTCSNPVTCNSPNSTTDARGNVTIYEYDPNHGGVTRIRPPKPTPASPQPEIRYTYDLVHGERQLTGISQCQNSSACVGTADEVRTALAYDSNGNLYWTATGNGTGTLVAETTMTFDGLGNMETVDGPLPGTADTSRIRYNPARQVTGTVSPDPDGGGPLEYRAVRNSYNASTGLLEKVEQGSIDSQPIPDWGTFAPAQAVVTDYDDHARPIVGKLTSGSAIHSLSQTRYDALGRPECSAQRMNLAAFATVAQTTSACALGPQGGEGPDRISRALYDPAGRVTEVKIRTGPNPADEESEGTATYSLNGQVETVTDGEGNKTTYVYDGHDRLLATRYPLPAKGAQASAPMTGTDADLERYTYESLAGGTRTSGLVAAFRNRAGESTVFGFDSLGRTTSKDLPGSEPDASYTYDLLGRMLSATQNGVAVSFTWDVLGRQLTQTIPIPGVAVPVFTSEWDLAGRRTRYTWPVDASGPTAYYVDYDYLVTGEVDKIREKGAVSGVGVLASFGYDDLGRRTSLTRGNGAVTSYQYDGASRLDSMTHDFAGSATHDLTLEFDYNPASQIVSTTRSNSLYSWTGHGSGTTSSPADGLNRIADLNGVDLSYDPRGNLLSDGAFAYTYSSENLMTSGANSGLLEYDPLMRFYKSGPTYFIHEGGQLVGDYYNGNIVGRYVPGPATDEPLVQVDKLGNRTWYHADERGSVIAGSGASGANSKIVLFDEYGKRGSGGSYRFGFTGQVHLINDVYDYKARNYNARLGRFLQTDPIGYGDGMNMYGYVGGDPVNFTDPTGLCGAGEVAVQRNRTSRGEADPGDVVGLYRFFCMRVVFEEGAGGGAGVGNSGGDGTSAGKVQCKLGGGAIDVSFDGTTVTITAKVNLDGPGAPTSGAYIGGIGNAWTKSFGHINSIANISAGPGGVTAHISNGRFPPGGARSNLGGNEMWLGNLGDMPDWQKPFAINHVAPHEFGHSLKIDNMPVKGKWAGSIMANSANNVSATDLEAVIEACRAAE